MNARESRGCLERAEALLRQAAERLIQSPLDPGRACAALESAKLALEALRREPTGEPRELFRACERVIREAGRVGRLLEGAAMFSFPCFGAVWPAGYTAAGELQAPAQPKRFVLEG